VINSKLDFEKIRQAYQVRNRIIIPDFLNEPAAEYIYKGFQDITANNLWYQMNYGNHKFFDKSKKFYVENKAHFTYKYEKYPVQNIPLSGLIAFRHNTEHLIQFANNPELELPENHAFRKLGEMLNSKEMHNIIAMITGLKITPEKVSCFASRYTAGDYNGAHDDGNAPRVVAFVLNMTKYWLPHWGGNLTIFDDRYENIIDIFMPKFNSFSLFNVPLPHAVLPVSIFCQSERLAVSGWYHNFNLPG
jgi:Rps23 Pro-64 3,4-dihydroxylase Tpa1-like proline 4-hydroxylase